MKRPSKTRPQRHVWMTVSSLPVSAGIPHPAQTVFGGSLNRQTIFWICIFDEASLVGKQKALTQRFVFTADVSLIVELFKRTEEITVVQFSRRVRLVSTWDLCNLNMTWKRE